MSSACSQYGLQRSQNIFGRAFAQVYEVSIAWLAGEGVEKLDPHDDRLQLAFRELQKLKQEDLAKGLALLVAALAAIRQK